MRADARLAGAHALGAAAGAALVVWLGPPGADFAAHVYQRAMFLEHGFALWNNYWYAGRYSYVTYSLVYYPLAGLLGIKALALVSAAIAAGAFALLVEHEWPTAGRWPARAFTVVSAASVLTGAFPYALGLGVALGALVCLRQRRMKTFALLVVLTFAASPLAFALLAVVLGGAAFAHGRHSIVAPVAVVLTVVAVAVVLQRVFPDGGRFPYSTAEFAASLAFCIVGVAFTWRVAAARVLRYVFVAYALACAAAFVVPSAIGENVARLRFVAVPVAVLALSLRRWKPLLPAVAALLLATSWNFTPLASSYSRGASDPSSHAAYWQPVLRFLARSLGPSYRVEAVDTSGHWDAVYLARAGVPIARGWFRQDDFPQNRVLYGDFGRRSYLHWLRRLGVEFVVLTDAPLDYSARTEAALLRSGRSGLVPAFRSAHATVYRVPHASPIVVGPAPARVLALRPSSVVLEVARAGTYRVAVRYTPYWSSPAACVTKTPDGMIDLVARRPGVITLHFAVTARRAVAAAAGVIKKCA